MPHHAEAGDKLLRGKSGPCCWHAMFSTQPPIVSTHTYKSSKSIACCFLDQSVKLLLDAAQALESKPSKEGALSPFSPETSQGIATASRFVREGPYTAMVRIENACSCYWPTLELGPRAVQGTSRMQWSGYKTVPLKNHQEIMLAPTHLFRNLGT